MQEFEIPVIFKGKELMLPAQLLQLGYIYVIEVKVGLTNFRFERDEEREWRALITPEEIEKNRNIDVELLHSIAESIENILKP